MTARVSSRFAPAVYRLLLHALPRDLRSRYGEDMVRVFGELHRDARSEGSRSVVSVWWRAVTQVVGGGLNDRFGRRPPRRGRSETRTPRGATMLEHFGQDLRFSLRVFRRQPGFAATTVGILALGIGLTTAIFSFVDGIVLRPLPYPDPERIVYFDQGSHTPPAYQEWVERLSAFESVAAVWSVARTMLGNGPPQQLTVGQPTANLLPMFGMTPARGRLLVETDAGGAPVAVLAYEFWQREFGGNESVLGRSIQLDGSPYEVVGVAQRGFRIPRRLASRVADVWTPLDVHRAEYQNRGFHVLRVAGRLEENASLESARGQMEAWEEWAAEEFPQNNVSSSGEIMRVPLLPMRAAETASVRNPLFMLMGAVGGLLLIACANVANLLLARGADRGRELAVRAALGGSGSRLVSQLLTESLVLALIGAVVGLGVAYASVTALSAVLPDNVPRFHEVGVDLRALAFTLTAAIVTGVAFGIAPAFYGSRANVSDAFKDASGRASSGSGHLKLKNALVVSEIALALVLLVGAGLLFNSFVRLARVDPGFEPENVYSVPLTFGSLDALGGGHDGAGRVQLVRDILDEIGSLPGIQSVAGAPVVPFTDFGRCCMMSVSNTVGGADTVGVVIHATAPGLFETLRLPLRAGRDVRWSDAGSAELPIVITRTMAERFFDNPSPLGEGIIVGRSRPRVYTIIGVVEDPKFWSLSEDNDFDLFVPYDTSYAGQLPFMHLAVRTAGGIEGVPDLLRRAIWSFAPAMPIPEITPLPSRIAETVSADRLLSILLAVFSICAMFLAAAGIYGTMLYAVSQRSHEFGIRMALGANTVRIVRQVLGRGMLLTGAGVALGLLGAVAVARVLESLVFGITTRDVPTYAGVTAILSITAVVACYLPARKAARLDPMETLRGE